MIKLSSDFLIRVLFYFVLGFTGGLAKAKYGLGLAVLWLVFYILTVWFLPRRFKDEVLNEDLAREDFHIKWLNILLTVIFTVLGLLLYKIIGGYLFNEYV